MSIEDLSSPALTTMPMSVQTSDSSPSPSTSPSSLTLSSSSTSASTSLPPSASPSASASASPSTSLPPSASPSALASPPPSPSLIPSLPSSPTSKENSYQSTKLSEPKENNTISNLIHSSPTSLSVLTISPEKAMRDPRLPLIGECSKEFSSKELNSFPEEVAKLYPTSIGELYFVRNKFFSTVPPANVILELQPLDHKRFLIKDGKAFQVCMKHIFFKDLLKCCKAMEALMKISEERFYSFFYWRFPPMPRREKFERNKEDIEGENSDGGGDISGDDGDANDKDENGDSDNKNEYNGSKIDSSKINSGKINDNKINNNKINSGKINSSKIDNSKINDSKIDSKGKDKEIEENERSKDDEDDEEDEEYTYYGMNLETHYELFCQCPFRWVLLTGMDRYYGDFSAYHRFNWFDSWDWIAAVNFFAALGSFGCLTPITMMAKLSPTDFCSLPLPRQRELVEDYNRQVGSQHPHLIDKD